LHYQKQLDSSNPLLTSLTPDTSNDLPQKPITNHEPPNIDNTPLDETNDEITNLHVTNDNQLNDDILGDTTDDIIENDNSTIQKSRYGRTIKKNPKYQEYCSQFTPTTLVSTTYNPMAYSEVDPTAEYEHPLIHIDKAVKDPDTLYMHKALKAPDDNKFKEAMVLEINQHTIRNNWTPVHKDTLPEGTIILPAIWAMQHKRRIDNHKIYKWKSRLNLGGHKMQQGIHFDETFSPVVTWQTI
jgi:hypothetical protein